VSGPAAEVAGAPARILRARDLWAVVARSLLLQALWNRERMQGQGLAFALRPVARRLAGSRGEAAWLARHLGYFNSHPVLASYALGAVARLEEERALGAGAGEEVVARAKVALGSALAAVGDSFFWSTLRPLAAAIGILWVLQGSPWGPLVFWLLYNSAHALVRARGVFVGRELGLAVMGERVQARLAGLRGAFRLVGVLVSAALVDTLVGELAMRGRLGGALWVLGGLAAGLLWGERRLSAGALGIGIFLVALAWATLTR
jgi:PTS system mannose-specific IID component